MFFPPFIHEYAALPALSMDRRTIQKTELGPCFRVKSLSYLGADPSFLGCVPLSSLEHQFSESRIFWLTAVSLMSRTTVCSIKIHNSYLPDEERAL
jgi:hypothetical protein